MDLKRLLTVVSIVFFLSVRLDTFLVDTLVIPDKGDSVLPAIALSILNLQAAAFDNAQFDNVGVHSTLSNCLIPFSRFGLLRYVFVNDGAKPFFTAM